MWCHKEMGQAVWGKITGSYTKGMPELAWAEQSVYDTFVQDGLAYLSLLIILLGKIQKADVQQYLLCLLDQALESTWVWRNNSLAVWNTFQLRWPLTRWPWRSYRRRRTWYFWPLASRRVSVIMWSNCEYSVYTTQALGCWSARWFGISILKVCQADCRILQVWRYERKRPTETMGTLVPGKVYPRKYSCHTANGSLVNWLNIRRLRITST